jgi:hypothetical protein
VEVGEMRHLFAALMLLLATATTAAAQVPKVILAEEAFWFE